MSGDFGSVGSCILGTMALSLESGRLLFSLIFALSSSFGKESLAV